MPIDASTAERWGLVSQVVPPTELMKTARALAETILNNHGKLIQDYKAVINEGIKLPLGEALLLEKVCGYWSPGNCSDSLAISWQNYKIFSDFVCLSAHLFSFLEEAM